MDGTEIVDVTVISDNLTGSITNSGNFFIGRNISSNFYDGFIDEFSVWDKELSGSEVTEIYNSGCPGNLNTHSAIANRVSWWKMGENVTTGGGLLLTVADEDGTNNATAVNMEDTDVQSITPC
jgi:hypothetical protein